MVTSASLSVCVLGTSVPYDTGMAEMRATMRAVAEDDARPTLLLLEHAPVITVTRAHGLTHLKSTPEAIAGEGIALVETDRGGDVTFHGPGQLVGYPIVKLERSGDDVGDGGRVHLDLVGYIRKLEAGLVSACAALGVRGAHVKEGMTGVWVARDPTSPAASWPDDDGAEKLVAIGVGVGKGGVTRHGFALNVTTALERYTEHIVPCGLTGRGVTSLERLLGDGCPAMDEVARVVADHVGRALGFDGVDNQGHSEFRSLAGALHLQKQGGATDGPRDGALHG